jgi:chromosome segregation ATPase
MNDSIHNDEQVNYTEPTPQRQRSWWTPVLAAGLLGVGGYTAYQSTQLEDLRRQVAASQRDSVALRSNLASTDGELQKTIDSLQSELATSRKETTASFAKAQSAAKRQTDALAGKIEKRQQEQQAQSEQLSAELTKVKESTDDASTKISGITTEVGSVKTEVETTKSTLQNTLNDLQRVRGDMGVMSGLIATNGKEIHALRELGDRNIYEFTLNKDAGLQRVGDIQVRLRKADVKRNRYTVEVVADDKRVEKKDKGTNEPVQFYVVSKARQPYELVVNDVKKDQVTGYLSTPKVTVSRTSGDQ